MTEDPIRPDDAAFERAYGKFMLAWADAENQLYHVLRGYAKTEDAIARAVFSGLRAKGMIDFIRAIAHNAKMDKERLSDLEYVFPQMVHINAVRDALAHYATYSVYAYPKEAPELRIWGNHVRVSRYGNEQLVAVSPETLAKLTEDLYFIGNCLNMHWEPSGARQNFRSWRAAPNPGANRAWLYIPPQPESAGRKPPLGSQPPKSRP